MDTERRRVGRYRLLSRIGEGGMGEVHRARAYGAEGVVKDLCVKLIRAEGLARPGAGARFVGEARVSMRLNHGNIVAVFDFGRCGEAYFLAMEWVDGADVRALLSDLARRGERLEPDVAAHVAAEIARALSYAHELPEPVVHCDLKPENVLVSAAGDVKLADFGLAMVARDGAPNALAGTPGYMAPEQRGGAALGPRTDLWALGVLLAELAGGARDADAIDDPELAAVARALLAEAQEDRPAQAASVANRLEAFVARARAEGSASPRERLAQLARRARRDGDEGERDLEATASFVRDGADAEFLRSMSMLSTVPPSTVPPSTAELATPAPRARRALPVAAMAIALAVVAAAYGLGERARDSAEASPRGERPASPVQSEAGVVAPELAGHAADSLASDVGAMAAPREAAPLALAAPPRAVAPVTPPGPLSRRPRRAAPRAPQRAEPQVLESQVAVAHLSLNAVPWSAVEIDGAPVGVTPIFDHPLAPGVHRIRFTNAPLGATVERTVELSPGEARRLVVDLGRARSPQREP